MLSKYVAQSIFNQVPKDLPAYSKVCRNLSFTSTLKKEQEDLIVERLSGDNEGNN